MSSSFVYTLSNGAEDHHGPSWLNMCGRIMPVSMFWRELFTYGGEGKFVKWVVEL